MTNKRRFGRIAFGTDISIEYKGKTYPGNLQDIAMKGALLHFDELPPIKMNDSCQLSIQLVNSDIVLHFKAEAIHFHQEAIGFKFTETDLDTMAHLRRLLELNTGDPEKVEQEISFLANTDLSA